MKNKNVDFNSFPSSCGVYFFKNNDEIIYVGKAKNLKNRIKQYFNGSINSFKTPLLLEKFTSIDFLVCSNEKESLLLEQEMIKKYRPYFNILLLDDKKYPYIVIQLKNNKLEFKTKFFFKNEPNSYYCGPLPPNYGYKIIKDFLIRECLYENGLPIQNKDQTFWKQKFDYAKKILSFSNNEIVSKLKKQMIIASENEQYEIAKDFRDVIEHLTNTKNDQSIIFDNQKDFDVIAFKKVNNLILINIHNFRNGNFFMQEDFIFEINIDYYNSLVSFLNYYYSIRNKIDLIVTNENIQQEDIIIESEILIPKKGQYLNAINNCLKNIEIDENKRILQYEKKINTIDKLKNFFYSLTNTEINDFIIIDNSNDSNKNVVSVILYYKNYLPFYSNFRKYNLNQDFSRKSDVEYIKLGLDKYIKNKENLPDLIIVDGSRQQISEARKVLTKHNMNLPILGLVKDNNHETRNVIDINGKSHNIEDRDIYNFLAKIQTEVDAFAKKYHSKIQINSSLEGFLSTIKGIGPKLEKKLLDSFKTYSNIYNASFEELEKIVPSNIAKKIIEKLKN